MKLFDIGNSRVHLYEDSTIEHFNIDYFDYKKIKEKVFYISVNKTISKRLKDLHNWIDLSAYLKLFYETIGIDRQVVCMAENDAVIIDAGSAITVDVMENGEYSGGYILPGLRAMQNCYRTISPALDTSFNFELSLDKMATNTRDSITFGYLGTFALHINSLGKKVFLTGGDAKRIKPLFENVIVEEGLVFRGMLKIINEEGLC